jgi:two-component system cell cycle sensor histidine kinase/response regulator CckA
VTKDLKGMIADPQGVLDRGTSTDPGTILVVDDDQAVLNVACKVLRRGGYDVVPATGAEEALEVAESHQGRFDLLLTDLVMPGMSGRELAEEVVARFPAIQVLYMSAYTDDEIVLDGLKTSDVRFIPKPFTVDGLREKVRRVIAGED